MTNGVLEHFPVEVVPGSPQKMRPTQRLERYPDPTQVESALARALARALV